MLSFKQFYHQSLNEDKNIHQLHLEQTVFESPEEINNTISIIRDLLKGFETGDIKNITQKWDGCIHPDTILKTDKGDIKIIDIINSNEQYKVYSYNFNKKINELNDIVHPRINDNNKNWVEILLENNHKLICTEDHKIYTTNRGWIEAKDLTDNDNIKEI